MNVEYNNENAIFAASNEMSDLGKDHKGIQNIRWQAVKNRLFVDLQTAKGNVSFNGEAGRGGS